MQSFLVFGSYGLCPLLLIPYFSEPNALSIRVGQGPRPQGDPGGGGNFWLNLLNYQKWRIFHEKIAKSLKNQRFWLTIFFKTQEDPPSLG